MALPSNLAETNQSHLQALIDQGIEEGPHLDFKRQLPSDWTRDAKQAFLADITAFANAGGGDLVYGIDEVDAVANAIVPMTQENWDERLRCLQDFLLHDVEPRVAGVQFQRVTVSVNSAGGSALVVRVPQSWSGPHRIKTNHHFYVREGQRNRQLNVPELRELILRSETMGQGVRDFRTERLGRILSGETPVKLATGPALVIHIVPTQAALGSVQIDVAQYVAPGMLHIPRFGPSTSYSTRINLDGSVLVGVPGHDGSCATYTVLFRNGFVEAVRVLNRYHDRPRAVLPSRAFEDWIIEFVRAVRTEMQRQGIATEMSVMLSILHTREAELGLDHVFTGYSAEQCLFDRDVVALPDVLTQGEVSAELALRPVFDLMWQAAGFARSFNVHVDGHRLSG